MVAVDHGFEFSAEQFFKAQDQILARVSIAERRSVHLLRGKSANSHQEVDFYLNAVGAVSVVLESEIPLAQGVVVDAILELVAKTRRDLLDSRNDFWTVLERRFTVDVPDVVQIDVDGEPRKIEVKEIEGRAALENEFSFKSGVFVEFDKKLAKAENLLKIFGRKARVCGEFADLRGSEFHVGTELVREGRSVSGTMSFHVGTQRWPGRLSAR